MLVLHRRRGEEILLSGGIRVVVLAVRGGDVKLGIEAPLRVNVVRGEVARRCPQAAPDGRVDAPGGSSTRPRQAARGGFVCES